MEDDDGDDEGDGAGGDELSDLGSAAEDLDDYITMLVSYTVVSLGIRNTGFREFGIWPLKWQVYISKTAAAAFIITHHAHQLVRIRLV